VSITYAHYHCDVPLELVQNVRKRKKNKHQTHKKRRRKTAIEKEAEKKQRPFKNEMNTYLHENEKALLTVKSR